MQMAVFNAFLQVKSGIPPFLFRLRSRDCLGEYMPSKTKKIIPKERATVKVVWYNRLKGFGEGVTKDGRYVFLHYTAMDKDQDKVNLEIGKEYGANLIVDEGKLVAYSLWDLHPKAKSKIVAELRRIEANLKKVIGAEESHLWNSFEIGDSVMLKHDVKHEEGVAKKGLTGTIVHLDGGGCSVELDKKLDWLNDKNGYDYENILHCKYSDLTSTPSSHVIKKSSSDFDKWLDTFLEEKGIDLDEGFTVQGANWGDNHMTYGVVVEHIKIAPKGEQNKIKDMLVKIDFKNGDVRHFLRHLAQAIAL